MGDGVEIGLREVYDAVQALRGDVNAALAESRFLAYRVEQLEKASTEQASSRPVWLGVAAGWVASLVALVVPFMVR